MDASRFYVCCTWNRCCCRCCSTATGVYYTCIKHTYPSDAHVAHIFGVFMPPISHACEEEEEEEGEMGEKLSGGQDRYRRLELPSCPCGPAKHLRALKFSLRVATPAVCVRTNLCQRPEWRGDHKISQGLGCDFYLFYIARKLLMQRGNRLSQRIVSSQPARND